MKDYVKVSVINQKKRTAWEDSNQKKKEKKNPSQIQIQI